MIIKMERKEVFEKLNGIFSDILDVEDVRLNEQTCADDIDEWDSLSHIQLIVAVEKEFGIKFSSREIMKWSNVGQMVDTILERI